MTAAATRLVELTESVTTPISRYGAPVADLLARIWIGLVFFRSGLQKVQDWENTLLLFEYEYVLPVLPPTASAYIGTAFELAAPIFLFLGLGARFAAVPLLTMAMTIQFYLGAQNPAYNSFEHYAWMVFLLLIITRGPGVLSADHVLHRVFGKEQPHPA